MQRRFRLLKAGLVWTCLTSLGACTFDAAEVLDRRPDYRTSQVEDPLEVPPDLTSSTIDDTLMVPELSPTGSATLSAYASERSGNQVVASEAVLQEPLGMSLQRDGDRRWLLVDQPPSTLWSAIKAFWTTNGFLLDKEDPRIGIMETDWAENRADIPDGVIRSLLGRVADFTHSAATRDKFRVRLERVDGGSEVFLVHYGMEEVLTGESGTRANSPRTSGVAKWRPRPSDPELEAEMLRRLMVYLGADEQRGEQQLTAATTTTTTLPPPKIRRTTAPNGQTALLIEENYAQAWRLVGLALDRSDYPVEDQNRSQGLYVVGYQNPTATGNQDQDQGLLSGLAFWRNDNEVNEASRHQVRLAGQGSQTLVVIQNAQGQPDRSSEAMRLLDALGEAIN